MASISVERTPDGAFSYREAGDRAGVPVVFLHGIGGSSRLWSRQLVAFGDRYRAIAWDMPGYGASRALPVASVGTYGDALADFLKALRLERPVLVGHSIGGMVVQSYLADALGPVQAAGLIQTTAAFGGRDPTWARDFVAARLRPLDEGETLRTMAAGLVDGMTGRDPDPDGVALARDVVAETPDAAYRASTLSMIGFDRREALDRIAIPALLLAGGEDRNAPAATMEKMASRIAKAEYVCLDGCGHLVMAERPAAFESVLGSFLDRMTGAAA